MGRRTRARECAFQMVYLWDRTRQPFERVARSFWGLRSTTDETRERAEALAKGALERVEELDKAIEAAATHWRLDRIASADLCVMRVAAFELKHEPETPPAVVIDEAVELAKRFCDAGSPAFVNGILDAIRRGGTGGAQPPRLDEDSQAQGDASKPRRPRAPGRKSTRKRNAVE